MNVVFLRPASKIRNTAQGRETFFFIKTKERGWEVGGDSEKECITANICLKVETYTDPARFIERKGGLRTVMR